MDVILKTQNNNKNFSNLRKELSKKNQFSQFSSSCVVILGSFYSSFFILRVILGNCIVTFAYINVTVIYKVHANIYLYMFSLSSSLSFVCAFFPIIIHFYANL